VNASDRKSAGLFIEEIGPGRLVYFQMARNRDAGATSFRTYRVRV